VNKPVETSPDSLADAIVAGKRRALARAITLIESSRPDHRETADALLRLLLPHTGKSIRIGVSGVPGVGKSSFIEAFGKFVIQAGHRVAVLAVDPSSPRTGGSILGDKTRMEELARHGDAFIRPSPSGGALGGVARRTREALLACEAAGFDVIIVETVGVGQSEIAVADLADLFLLLLAPAAGDELQGIKKGIVELADLIVVNKADGDLKAAAERAWNDYANALHLLSPASSLWTPPVMRCSALTGDGIAQVWETVERYRAVMEPSLQIAERRREQARAWMWRDITDTLTAKLRDHPDVKKRAKAMEQAVIDGHTTPSEAARILIEAFTKS
jgi:LAO/AO transport system kinase